MTRITDTSQGWIIGPLFVLLYINGFPKIISNMSKPVLLADSTSVIITNSAFSEFKKC